MYCFVYKGYIIDPEHPSTRSPCLGKDARDVRGVQEYRELEAASQAGCPALGLHAERD